MRRKQFELVIRRRRAGSSETAGVELRHADGTRETFDSIDELPPKYRPLLEKIMAHAQADAPWEEMLERSTFKSERPAKVRRRKKSKQALELSYAWFDPLAALGGTVMGGFCLWSIRGSLRGQDPWTWWPILATILACVMAYLTLAFLINRTDLTADDSGLMVHHGPLPWPGNGFIPRNEIRQLYVSVAAGRRHSSYSLCAYTTAGWTRLIGDVRDPVELREIEVMLEDRLGIVDRPVSGNQFR